MKKYLMIAMLAILTFIVATPAFAAGVTVYQANPAELPTPAKITINATPGEIHVPCTALDGATILVKQTTANTPLPDAELVSNC